MQNDPTGTACFGTGRKAASDDASIPDAMCGDERRFGTGVRLGGPLAGALAGVALGVLDRRAQRPRALPQSSAAP